MDVNEVVKANTALMLVNQHYSLSGVQPLSPQLVQIGGIHINHTQLTEQLPHNIEDFLRNAKEDVIYISWGSMLRTFSLDPNKVQAILRAFENLPFNVIWKWENDNVPTKSNKFLFVKWAPQFRLLCKYWKY